MDAFLKKALLYDLYGAFLTKKQRRAIDLNCNHDYSLSEISALMGVSRQAVHDLIKRGSETLNEMDDKLGLITRRIEERKKLEDIAVNSIDKNTSENIEKFIEEYYW